MTPRWDIKRWLKHCKSGLRWVCTFGYSGKILQYLLYSALEYQNYGLKYSTQILSTKSMTSNTLPNIWVPKLWPQILYSAFEFQKYDIKYSAQNFEYWKYDPLKSTQIWVTLLNTPLEFCAVGYIFLFSVAESTRCRYASTFVGPLIQLAAKVTSIFTYFSLARLLLHQHVSFFYQWSRDSR